LCTPPPDFVPDTNPARYDLQELKNKARAAVKPLRIGVDAIGSEVRGRAHAGRCGECPALEAQSASVAKERGWPPVTRAGFDSQRGPHGALLIGSPDEVAEKILRHDEALGGFSRISFQMNAASLPHERVRRATDAIGSRVAPALRKAGSSRSFSR
jgi:alkanesulfonate monooxygenase SsuD/methylene tetrahydromethanopterin reductase-like flavin-dependent oxidoreductase (luciferase family)